MKLYKLRLRELQTSLAYLILAVFKTILYLYAFGYIKYIDDTIVFLIRSMYIVIANAFQKRSCKYYDA